jgi:electron transport complex protein RnfC
MRKVFDFHGGIHPPENKHQSLSLPIAWAGVPPELTLPLSQHIGAPAVPVVSVGDKVLKGQLIAEAKGYVSVPVHAPTSGTISAVEERSIAHPSGFKAPCIVIKSDGNDEWITLNDQEDYTRLSKPELLNTIRDSGIAGMGGAGFPAAVKLSIRSEAKVETLILNGTECEPYITADDILMRERADQIIAGAKILAQLINPQETLIGVEDNKPEGIASLRRAAQGTDIQIVQFPTKYPSGGEKQLVEILTGKQVPSGGLPLDVGVVCQNIGSAVAIYEAVVLGRPLISRITTVTGESVDEAQNFEVLLGTPMSYLLEKAGYQSSTNKRLIMGGPMMGFTVPDSDVPIVKTTNCILAPTEAELPTPPPAQACIRCGMCAEVCPASLLPQQMFWFAQGKEHEKLEQHNLFDCIECGACSWVCPSAIPLVQYYRASKAEILQARRDHEKSEQSRLRFESRQERLDREEAEKDAKRAARKLAAEQRAVQAAQGSSDAEDPIQAAIDRAKAKKAAQQAAAEKAFEGYQATQKGDSTKKTDAPQLDAAQAAIQKAMAARVADSALSPAEKAGKNLEKLRQRLQKTETKLEECRRNGEEEKIIDALAATVERLGEKIVSAEEAVTQAEES